MRFQTLGDKPAFVANNFKNAETVTISRGMAAVLSFNATDDGLAVVLPSTAGAVKSMRLFAGVAMEDVAPNQIGQFMDTGYCRSLTLIRQTRPTSTDTWQTEATIAAAVLLGINTVANGFNTVASTIAYASTDPLTVSVNQYHAILAQSLASYASSASATSDTRTVISASVKAWIRAL